MVSAYYRVCRQTARGAGSVDYPANIKQQQVNWIGKSTGAFVNFQVDGLDEQLRIYTTRPDTLLWRYLYGYRAGASAD